MLPTWSRTITAAQARFLRELLETTSNGTQPDYEAEIYRQLAAIRVEGRVEFHAGEWNLIQTAADICSFTTDGTNYAARNRACANLSLDIGLMLRQPADGGREEPVIEVPVRKSQASLL